MIFKDIQIINSRIKIEQDYSKQNRKTHYRHFARSFKEVPVLNILDSIPLRNYIVAKQCYSRMTNMLLTKLRCHHFHRRCWSRITARILVTKIYHYFWPNKLELEAILIKTLLNMILRDSYEIDTTSRQHQNIVIFPKVGPQWKSMSH